MRRQRRHIRLLAHSQRDSRTLSDTDTQLIPEHHRDGALLEMGSPLTSGAAHAKSVLSVWGLCTLSEVCGL